MGQGRSSAILAMIFVCLIYCEVASAAIYTVGDAKGWTFNVAAWPKGKRFRAGDVLVFKYSPAAHNVVAVDRAGYSSCNAGKGSKVYSSGNDKIKLVKGPNYFICTFPGHCQSAMKVAVTAL